MTAIQPIVAAFLTLFAAWLAMQPAILLRAGTATATEAGRPTSANDATTASATVHVPREGSAPGKGGAPGTLNRRTIAGQLLTGASFLLFVRLITDFGGWTSWFLYVWLAGIVGFSAGTAVIAARWPSIPARAASTRADRAERTGLWSGAIIAGLVAAALVVPRFFL